MYSRSILTRFQMMYKSQLVTQTITDKASD